MELSDCTNTKYVAMDMYATLFIYGACSTTQGLQAVLLRVGIMYYVCFLLLLLPTQNSEHIT